RVSFILAYLSRNLGALHSFPTRRSSDLEREQELALALCARRVDGLVVIPAGDDHRYLEPEIRAGVATVFVDRPAGKIDADVVLRSEEHTSELQSLAYLVCRPLPET